MVKLDFSKVSHDLAGFGGNAIGNLMGKTVNLMEDACEAMANLADDNEIGFLKKAAQAVSAAVQKLDTKLSIPFALAVSEMSAEDVKSSYHRAKKAAYKQERDNKRSTSTLSLKPA